MKNSLDEVIWASIEAEEMDGFTTEEIGDIFDSHGNTSTRGRQIA